MATTRERQLMSLQAAIRACTRCVEAGYLTQANPVVRGGLEPAGMLIGQAPGPRALQSGLPWSGPAGKLLRNWFARAGYDPERFLDEWYFTAITRCFPGKAAHGPGDRVPSSPERALCRSHLDAEIALVRPRVVTTLGRLAADTFIPGAKGLALRELIGEVYPVDLGYGPIPIVPLPHPSGVGRWLNDPANRELVDRAMDRLGEIRATQDGTP
jgi:uracil-DNA glycosylase